MRKGSIFGVALLSSFPMAGQIGVHADQLKSKIAELRGGRPLNWLRLPDLPPNGFYAICIVKLGSCVVEGNAPIPPRSPCHCGSHPGQTQ